MSETEPMNETNDQLVLIVGYSATGKSASFRNIRNQERWMHFNTEAGKRLPFRNKFQTYRITDPLQVIEGFDHMINNPNDFDGGILDSLTFHMDMYESLYVLGSSNTMQGWSNYFQHFKTLMQEKIVLFNKPTIITAHVKDEYDEKNLEMKTFVPIKGALKNAGIEAYFSTIVASKRMTIKDLEKFESKLLNITEEERALGFKYVFQTRLTAKTTGERIRSPMEMFKPNETYMDNDVQILLDRLKSFYGV